LKGVKPISLCFHPPVHQKNFLHYWPQKGIAANNNHFYAYRLIKKLGIDIDDGVLRLSFAHYNTMDETIRLIDALTAILG